MPSSWTHAATAIATAALLVPRDVPRSTWVVVGVAAVALDLDALPRLWGGDDLAWLGGHRAFTHSLTFALVFGAFLSLTMVQGGANRLGLWFALAAAMATHGLMDALVSYGGGVQFLSPFSATRYESPWKLLGDGIVRDTVAFIVAYITARLIIRRRRHPMPALLDPSLFRTHYHHDRRHRANDR